MFLYLLVSLSLLFSKLSFSSEIEDPIIVETARGNPQKTFSSHYGATAIKGDELYRFNDGEELAQKLPGLTAAGGTSRARFFQIRGIGERSSYEGMPNESVTVLVDGIDYTGIGGVLETFGLSQLEVYKGPQNTVMGPSALGGMIRAETQSSGNTLKASGESFDGRSVGGALSFKEGHLKGSSVTHIRESDGYFKNTFLNRDDTNFKEELVHRTKLFFKNFEINLHYLEFNSGYDVFNLNNSKETQSEDPGRDDQRTLGLSLIHSKKLNHLNLRTAISGHRTQSFYSYDEDWGNSSSYDYRIGFSKSLNNINLEERVSWRVGNAFHVTGLFFKNNHLSSRELGFNAEVARKDLKATFKRRRVALFHETEYAFGNNFTIFSGGRVSYLDSKYRDSNNISVSPEETLWGGHIGFKKEMGADLISLRLSRGFKAGGVNIGTNINNARREFQNESMYGLDALWEMNRGSLRGKINLFATYRNDIQVKTSFQDNPSDPSSFTFYTDNATTGYSYGVETELFWRVFDVYQVTFSGNLMDTAYGSYTYGQRNLKGREFAYAPNYKFTLGQKLNIFSSSSILVENVFVDELYFGNSHNEKAPKFIMTNLTAAQEYKSFTFKLWVKNLFQARSETRGFFFGNRSPNFEDERFVQVGPPRMFGGVLEYTW